MLIFGSLDYQGYIFIWFCIEPCTGVICACLPALSPIFAKADILSRFVLTIKSLLPSSSQLRSRQSSQKSLDKVFIHRKDADSGERIFREERGLTEMLDLSTTKSAVDHVPLQDLERQHIQFPTGDISR